MQIMHVIYLPDLARSVGDGSQVFRVRLKSDFPFREGILPGVECLATGLPRCIYQLCSPCSSQLALILFGLVWFTLYRQEGSLGSRTAGCDRRLALSLFLAILVQPPLYDNFRHFLFIVPCVCDCKTGIAAVLDQQMPPGPCSWWQSPAGVYWLFQRHPYQYVYYNALVGGPGGSFRRFETDYWAFPAGSHRLSERSRYPRSRSWSGDRITWSSGTPGRPEILEYKEEVRSNNLLRIMLSCPPDGITTGCFSLDPGCYIRWVEMGQFSRSSSSFPRRRQLRLEGNPS
jgi:hypothetical protein